MSVLWNILEELGSEWRFNAQVQNPVVSRETKMLVSIRSFTRRFVMWYTCLSSQMWCDDSWQGQS